MKGKLTLECRRLGPTIAATTDVAATTATVEWHGYARQREAPAIRDLTLGSTVESRRFGNSDSSLLSPHKFRANEDVAVANLPIVSIFKGVLGIGTVQLAVQVFLILLLHVSYNCSLAVCKCLALAVCKYVVAVLCMKMVAGCSRSVAKIPF
uniref:Uncharacterized protein LOC104216724 n=1 Tax=Nicotiana sylvestris TaxID=4096 RepID=A0A1U7VRY2_NICSY|nr:PREDICTED: uncharacterized protein LOC104216724 [Nicotiana sylvestris]